MGQRVAATYNAAGVLLNSLLVVLSRKDSTVQTVQQMRAADFSGRRDCERSYNDERRISGGNSKAFMDRDGGSGCMCEACSSSLEFHADDGHRTVCGTSTSTGYHGRFGDSYGARSE